MSSHSTTHKSTATHNDVQQALSQLFYDAINTLVADDVLTSAPDNIMLMRTKDATHGDYSCNVAMMLAKSAGKNPRQLAQLIVDKLPASALVDKVEVAGAGFINVFLNANAKFTILDVIFEQAAKFGLSKVHAGKKIQIEYVSANPTSALHVGHGRGAAFGASLSNLLSATGYEVQQEYYVNDAGRQMDILAVSTFLRYLELCQEAVVFPSNGYQGDYVIDIAKQIYDKYGDKFNVSFAKIAQDVAQDALFEIQNEEKVQIAGDKEAHIDGLIANAQRLLGEDYEIFHHTALSVILTDIKEDLTQFGVNFDEWFSEKSVQQDVEDALKVLDERGYLYTKEGNVWFKSTAFGDEKDRVVKRANGQTTYFASDIAYHKNKLDRGFDTIIDIWGADHHGYIPRVKAALSAMGYDANRLEVILVQFVALWRGDEKVQMSSRSGQFITLRELRQEVGNDAARFYYVARTPNVHMDFDLQLAKSQSRDNAVYYIQYAHARICRVFEKLADLGLALDVSVAKTHLNALNKPIEDELIKLLSAYPEVVLKAADQREVHLVGNYLKDLASVFHSWYNDERLLPVSLGTPDVLEDELVLMQARLYLAAAVRQVLANGLSVLGLSAPRVM